MARACAVVAEEISRLDIASRVAPLVTVADVEHDFLVLLERDGSPSLMGPSMVQRQEALRAMLPRWIQGGGRPHTKLWERAAAIVVHARAHEAEVRCALRLVMPTFEPTAADDDVVPAMILGEIATGAIKKLLHTQSNADEALPLSRWLPLAREVAAQGKGDKVSLTMLKAAIDVGTCLMQQASGWVARAHTHPHARTHAINTTNPFEHPANHPPTSHFFLPGWPPGGRRGAVPPPVRCNARRPHRGGDCLRAHLAVEGD